MSIITQATFHAMCSVEANGGVSDFLPNSAHPGFSNVTLSGVGLWDFDVEQPVDATQVVGLATPRSATADCSCQWVNTSDASKRVRTYIAGVLASSVDFDFALFRLPDGLA